MDPRLNSLAQPIFWTPDADPWTMELQAASFGTGFRLTAEDIRRGTTASLHETHHHVVMAGERFTLALASPELAGPVAAIVPLDESTPDRLVAIERLWAAMHGRPVSDVRITSQRRQRAKQMLRVVDARDAGMTYRVIAEVLFPRHSSQPSEWVGSPIRETTIRLARDGVKLVHGGYRNLLRRPRRR